MDPPRNYKQIIEDFVEDKWHLLAKRPDIPPLPGWFKLKYLSEEIAQKVYGVRIPALTYWENGLTAFYLESEEYKKSIDKITCLLFDFDGIMEHFDKTKEYCDSALSKAKELINLDLTDLSDSELLSKHKEIVDSYAISFVYGYITWCAQVIQKYALSLLEDRKEGLNKLGINEKEAFGILVVPEKSTPYRDKERVLDELSGEYKERFENLAGLSEGKIKIVIPELHAKIMDFLEDYAWVGYDYTGPLMDYKEVIDSILSRSAKKGPESISRGDVLRACDFSYDEKKIFEVFSLIVYTKDLRNSVDDFVHYSLDKFYDEAGARFNLDRKEIRYLWPEEFEKLLTGEAEYNSDSLNDKMKYCSADTFNGENYLFNGKAKERIKGLLGEENPEYLSEINELKGTPASVGKAKGKVKVVHSVGDVDKVTKGDVLVTRMTSPRYMNGIMKATAIVTDEGGLTSHAAIIARELRKPCVIGTKIATKVLRDGDEVEVDADTGIVRILEKAKG